MRSLKAALVFTSLIGTSVAVPAGEVNYRCTVLTVQELDEWGMLQESSLPAIGTGAEFVVDRRTGLIAGDLLVNAEATSVQVIHPGGHGFDFTVVSNFRHSYAEVVWIQEQAGAPAKPFVALSLDGVVTGTCE